MHRWMTNYSLLTARENGRAARQLLKTNPKNKAADPLQWERLLGRFLADTYAYILSSKHCIGNAAITQKDCPCKEKRLP